MCLNFIEYWPSAQSSCQNENFVNTSKKTLEKQKRNFLLSVLLHMKTRISLRYLWMITVTNVKKKKMEADSFTVHDILSGILL